MVRSQWCLDGDNPSGAVQGVGGDGEGDNIQVQDEAGSNWKTL